MLQEQKNCCKGFCTLSKQRRLNLSVAWDLTYRELYLHRGKKLQCQKERNHLKVAPRTSLGREQSVFIPTSGIVSSYGVKQKCCCKPGIQRSVHSSQKTTSVSWGKVLSYIFSIKEKGEMKAWSSVNECDWAMTGNTQKSSLNWMTFTTGCHKQTQLMHLLITGKIYYTSVRERDKEKKIDLINNACTSFKHSWRKITGEVCNVTLIYAIGKKWVVKSSWVINHIYQWQD